MKKRPVRKAKNYALGLLVGFGTVILWAGIWNTVLILLRQNAMEELIALFTLPLLMAALLANKNYKDVSKLLLLSAILLFAGFFLTNIEILSSVRAALINSGKFSMAVGSLILSSAIITLLYKLMKEK